MIWFTWRSHVAGECSLKLLHAVFLEHSQALHHTWGWILGPGSVHRRVWHVQHQTWCLLCPFQAADAGPESCCLCFKAPRMTSEHCPHETSSKSEVFCRLPEAWSLSLTQESTWCLWFSQQTQQRWARPILRPNPGLISLWAVVTLDPCLSN